MKKMEVRRDDWVKNKESLWRKQQL